MKRYLFALPLLALGAPALANTSEIRFTGEVVTGSCPITITDPAGGTNGTIAMGDALTGSFGSVGAEVNYRNFAIKVADATTCPGWSSGGSNVGTVQFFGLDGGADSDNLFALKDSGASATGVALGIKDGDGTLVGHGGKSKPYPLTGGGAENLAFTAFYKSTGGTVGAGDANAEVSVEFTLN